MRLEIYFLNKGRNREMKKYSDNRVVELMRSGNFTIAYHDSEVASLYEGKYKYEDLPESAEIQYEDWSEGYCPKIVSLLTRALNGKSDSV